MKRTWLACGLAALLAACAAPAPHEDESGARQTIHVIHRGWHTDLALAAEQLDADGTFLREDFPAARYFVFGFGDRHYVLAQDKNFPEMLRALLPGAGLMLVTALNAPPQAAFGAQRSMELKLSDAQLAGVRAFIEAAFERPAAGRPARYGEGPYAGSLYYAARPRYSGLYTCNTWTAEALRAGGLPVTRFGILFADQVWDQVRELRAAQAEAR